MRRETARLDTGRAARRPGGAGTALATPPGPRPGTAFAILAGVSLVAQLLTMVCYALASARGHAGGLARLATFWPFLVLALGHAVGQAAAWLAGFDITRQRGLVGTVARGLVPTAVVFVVLGPLTGSLVLASLSLLAAAVAGVAAALILARYAPRGRHARPRA